MSGKTKIEVGVALASLSMGLVGAVLVEPIVLGVAAAGAAIATAMRLTDAKAPAVERRRETIARVG